MRNNESFVELESASRTVTQTGKDRSNHHCRGIIVVVDITVVGTGSITFKLQGKDANGIYYTILEGVALIANATTVYRVYPGLVAVGDLTVSDVLPQVYRIIITHNNANAIVYSVGVMPEV